MAEIDKTTYHTGSVFHALGLPDADDLLLRSERLMAISEIIAARGLSQREAGTLLGMDLTEIAALMRGNISKFSSERLARALRDLNSPTAGGGTPPRE